MEYQIEDITAYDNDSGKGLLASVFVNYEDHCKSVKICVHLPLERDKSLVEIEADILSEAKKQLKDLVDSF